MLWNVFQNETKVDARSLKTITLWLLSHTIPHKPQRHKPGHLCLISISRSGTLHVFVGRDRLLLRHFFLCIQDKGQQCWGQLQKCLIVTSTNPGQNHLCSRTSPGCEIFSSRFFFLRVCHFTTAYQPPRGVTFFFGKRITPYGSIFFFSSIGGPVTHPPRPFHTFHESKTVSFSIN